MAIQWKNPVHPEKLIPDPFGNAGTSVVNLDLQKLEAAWSKKPDYYVGKMGTCAGSSEKWEAIYRAIQYGSSLDMPILYTSNGNASSFQFVDGRHRTAVARDIGETRAPFVVPSGQSQAFITAFA